MASSASRKATGLSSTFTNSAPAQPEGDWTLVHTRKMTVFGSDAREASMRTTSSIESTGRRCSSRRATNSRRACCDTLVKISSPCTTNVEISKISAGAGATREDGPVARDGCCFGAVLASVSFTRSISIAACVARPIGASPMLMSSGEEPCGGRDERGLGWSSYAIVSIRGRTTVGASLAMSSAIAANVSRPMGPRLSVISGCEVSARGVRGGMRAGESAARTFARPVRSGGRDVLRRSGKRMEGSGRGVRLRSGLPVLTAKVPPQSGVSHAGPHPCNNWLRIAIA